MPRHTGPHLENSHGDPVVDKPTPAEVHRVLGMIAELAWEEFTARDEAIASWVVGWRDEDTGQAGMEVMGGGEPEPLACVGSPPTRLMADQMDSDG
jgi:hypothetical protein